jgi:hypothetical protein
MGEVASVCDHACERVHVCVCVRACSVCVSACIFVRVCVRMREHMEVERMSEANACGRKERVSARVESARVDSVRGWGVDSRRVRGMGNGEQCYCAQTI